MRVRAYHVVLSYLNRRVYSHSEPKMERCLHFDEPPPKEWSAEGLPTEELLERWCPATTAGRLTLVACGEFGSVPGIRKSSGSKLERTRAVLMYNNDQVVTELEASRCDRDSMSFVVPHTQREGMYTIWLFLNGRLQRITEQVEIRRED